MGLAGLDWLARRDGFDAMVITHDGRVLSTPGFDAWRQRNRPAFPMA